MLEYHEQMLEITYTFATIIINVQIELFSSILINQSQSLASSGYAPTYLLLLCLQSKTFKKEICV